GFHSFVSFRAKFPGMSYPKIKTQVEARLYDGCSAVGWALAPVVYPSHQGESVYMIADGLPGVQIYYMGDTKYGVKSGQSAAFCNHWYRVRVSVRELGTGVWGETQMWVRTYDTKTIAP
ncbi:MAG: hypothetical protein RIT45_1751, partial [Pseudomonadota bacterium]